MAQVIDRIERPATIEVRSPSTLEVLGNVPIASQGEVRDTVARARDAFRIWSGLGFTDRKRVLIDIRKRLVAHTDEALEIICRETGKPRFEALMMEIAYCCDALTFYGKNARRFLSPQRVQPHLLKSKKVSVHYHPRGVVGIISPWNFPLVMSLGEAIPALAAGNAVVIKPSEWTPLTAEFGINLAREAFTAAGLPADIIQVVNGFGETGTALVDEADMIAFTGSVRTGKLIAERAARRLCPVSLELGGKDPMIVLKDADLERASSAAVWGAFMNSGQVCISVERVYVESSVAEDFTQRVVEKTRKLRQGIEGSEQIDVGAIVFPRQLETIEEHVKDAVARGARLLAGGNRRDDLGGRFYEPTVLTDVDHSMSIMTDETFGPVLPIMKVKDADEALRLANDSRYGLNASVWSGDNSSGEKLATQVEAGTVCVNDVITGFAVTDASFGGMKESGNGRRHGASGIRRFAVEQTVVTDRFGMKRDPIWFPYTAKGERVARKLLKLLFG